jgi:hypothetical protein
MALTVSQMVTYNVLKYFKRTDKSNEVLQDITDTLQDMTRRHQFRDLKVEAYTTIGITTPTDYRLELPDDFEHLIGNVRLINGTESKPLNKLDKAAFDEKYPYLSNPDKEPGTPEDFCLWNDQILIGPIPDVTTYGYEISYCHKIMPTYLDPAGGSPIATDCFQNDNTILPLGEFKEAILSGTLARLFECVEDYEKAAYWHTRHDRDLAIIMGMDINNESAPTQQEYNGV